MPRNLCNVCWFVYVLSAPTCVAVVVLLVMMPRFNVCLFCWLVSLLTAINDPLYVPIVQGLFFFDAVLIFPTNDSV